MKVIVAGGGWAGCAAAVSAAKQGAEVFLIERTDMLLGTGLVGGIMHNNGRHTATEEMLALSGGEIFQLIDQNSLHKNIDFPGHRHAWLYNVTTMEPIIRRYLQKRGIRLHFATRITKVQRSGNLIRAVVGEKEKEEIPFDGEVYIDTTGTAGPSANCYKYGNGCAMCVLRCHAYGGRVSLTAKAGITEMVARKGTQTGSMSGSCEILKESLSMEIRDELNKKGIAVIPVSPSQTQRGKLGKKACQQYALAEYEENIILLDTGHAKLMTSYYPLEALREIPGFENARYEDPYAGGLGNSIRYIGMAPRDDALRVEGLDNLFCAGEKAGLLVGHTEAICTGTLAGYNAVRYAKKEKPLVLPKSLAIGDAIQYVRVQMKTESGLGLKYTFSGSVYFERMKQLGHYSTDRQMIEDRVCKSGLAGIFG